MKYVFKYIDIPIYMKVFEASSKRIFYIYDTGMRNKLDELR